MKLDTKSLRYLNTADWRILTAVDAQTTANVCVIDVSDTGPCDASVAMSVVDDIVADSSRGLLATPTGVDDWRCGRRGPNRAECERGAREISASDARAAASSSLI